MKLAGLILVLAAACSPVAAPQTPTRSQTKTEANAAAKVVPASDLRDINSATAEQLGCAARNVRKDQGSNYRETRSNAALQVR